jgi:4-carboxymuconolactone decarboxylase
VSAEPLDVRVARGRTTYARNLGLTEPDVEAGMTGRAGALFTAEAYLAAGGPAWHDHRATDRDRSVAVLAALVTQHVTDDRLEPYLALARRNGISDDGLEVLMLLLASYAGQPAASLGAAAVRRTRGRS